MTIVELDEKGRALLPASVRKKLGVRRFELKVAGDRLELVPIQDFRTLRGKYRNRLKTPWTKLEEKADEFVRNNKR